MSQKDEDMDDEDDKVTDLLFFSVWNLLTRNPEHLMDTYCR